MNTVNTNMNKDELRKFGLVTGGIFIGLFGLIFPFVLTRHYVLWPWIIGGVLVVWALVFPIGLAPVHKYWMKFSHVLGWINTRIILSVIFYILITPIGLIIRLFTRDPMTRKLDRNATTYRVASTTAPRENLKRPF